MGYGIHTTVASAIVVEGISSCSSAETLRPYPPSVMVVPVHAVSGTVTVVHTGLPHLALVLGSACCEPQASRKSWPRRGGGRASARRPWRLGVGHSYY